jgi:uncharacterized protein (DUF2235 family)
MHTNIVLLSDGTGNSSSSPFKTNVWRLYQAIDIAQPLPDSGKPRQIVYYDNGVGTETFKPLAALGGAFGIGVWKNVKDLYTFVCRNYQVGDQIYGFGFSRGAFTIRLLMGLIGKCGIVKAISEMELKHCVEMAYEAYRRDFLIRASKQRWMIYHHILRAPRYDKDKDGKPTSTIDLGACNCTQLFPDIRFVGVWDTVDAYGMPVDELKLAIDDWVWPMSFADRDPSKRLQTIRHALSLDDERPTFRPVLWNEVLKDKNDPKDESKWEILDGKTIQQVWFAGVHANVGGGYPDDGLAITALDWMMQEAGARGLRYIEWIRDEVAARANPQGEQYDSRAGLAGYYRYGPRKVADLCNDNKYGVQVPTVRVHPAAYQRVVAREREYAPVSLNSPFTVGAMAVPPADPLALNEAFDMVWWRRLAYFTTLGLTGFISLFALGLMFAWPHAVLSSTEAGLQEIAGLLWQRLADGLAAIWNGLLGTLDAALPSWAAPAIPAFKKYSLSAIVSLALLAYVFFFWAPKFQRRIAVHAEWAWAVHKKLDPPARPKTDWHNSVARKLRPITERFYRICLVILVPVLGWLIGIVALVLFSPFWIWRRLGRGKRCWMA